MCDLFPRHVLQADAPPMSFCGTPPLAFTFGLGGLLLLSDARRTHRPFSSKSSRPKRCCTPSNAFARQSMFTAPTFYRQMAPLVPRFDIASLKKTVSAGEALPDSTRQLWREASGIEMIDGIGGTEMIHIFVSSAGEDVRAHAIGKAVPGYRAQWSMTTCARCRTARSASSP